MSAPKRFEERQLSRLEADIYMALNSFQQEANWPQLRLAQMRQHLAEHIARELMSTSAGPVRPDEETTT